MYGVCSNVWCMCLLTLVYFFDCCHVVIMSYCNVAMLFVIHMVIVAVIVAVVAGSNLIHRGLWLNDMMI